MLDSQPRSLQPQHLRHVLRRLHHLPPRRFDDGESLHDGFHLECPSDLGGSFPDVADGVNLRRRLTVAEAHARECLASARLLMEKLYRRNPREWRKGNFPKMETGRGGPVEGAPQ